MANNQEDELKNDGDEPVKAPEKEEVVEVSKKDLSTLMAKLEDQGKTINLLYEAADKSRIAKILDRSNEPLVRTVRVSKYDPADKLVLGWKLTSNQSEIINGRWVEDQKTMLIFEDGTTMEVTLLDFYRKMSFVKAEVISKGTNTNSSGKVEESYKVRLDDGKELSLAINFIN